MLLLDDAPPAPEPVPVIVLVADGARPDALSGDLCRFPALDRLRREGGLYEITSVFPSVTGPAYIPFLMGRFPGAVGLPGLRWYDRGRTTCGWPDHARSYVGYEMSRLDGDVDAGAPTMFELAPHSIAAFSVLTRGLHPTRRVGALTPALALRAAITHFRGRADRWLEVDREIGEVVVRRMREERPDYLFVALTGMDKASHARGSSHAMVSSALAIVDAVAGRLREEGERAGWWSDTHLWVVSDHGHADVHTHEDLVATVERAGHRTMAHPFTMSLAPDVAVMVSGNAMAHLYVDLHDRSRRWWPALRTRWSALAELLLARPSVDLMLLPHDATRCEVRSATRGSAMLSRRGEELRYERLDGDPLGFGSDVTGTVNETHDATRDSDYPDAPVQILSLAGAARSGDMILSATPGYDFRARYEPIPHRSAHGALHREHMMVPLLTNRPAGRAPRRTTDLFASAVDVLGVACAGMQMDGESFV